MSAKAYLISWMEHERGWGQRPDGYTLHRTPEDATAYLTRRHEVLPADAR